MRSHSWLGGCGRTNRRKHTLPLRGVIRTCVHAHARTRAPTRTRTHPMCCLPRCLSMYIIHHTACQIGYTVHGATCNLWCCRTRIAPPRCLSIYSPAPTTRPTSAVSRAATHATRNPRRHSAFAPLFIVSECCDCACLLQVLVLSLLLVCFI
jgi:hypothetical protein